MLGTHTLTQHLLRPEYLTWVSYIWPCAPREMGALGVGAIVVPQGQLKKETARGEGWWPARRASMLGTRTSQACQRGRGQERDKKRAPPEPTSPVSPGMSWRTSWQVGPWADSGLPPGAQGCSCSSPRLLRSAGDACRVLQASLRSTFSREKHGRATLLGPVAVAPLRWEPSVHPMCGGR